MIRNPILHPSDETDVKPPFDLVFRDDGYHGHQIIQYVKACGRAEYFRLKKLAKDEVQWTTIADMDAAGAICWLEAHYKHEAKRLKSLVVEILTLWQKELDGDGFDSSYNWDDAVSLAAKHGINLTKETDPNEPEKP